VSHSIGEVLNRLKDEFEDITISKIRFLEAEGLINPDRTESGYRKFADGDIDRLRYVLRAQRDRYLPLKVIKDELDRIDHGLPLETPGTTPDADDVTTIQGDDHIPVVQTSLMASPTTDVALTTAELSEAVGLDVAVLQELVSNGVLPEHAHLRCRRPADRPDRGGPAARRAGATSPADVHAVRRSPGVPAGATDRTAAAPAQPAVAHRGQRSHRTPGRTRRAAPPGTAGSAPARHPAALIAAS
jgi:DNA-binding transcriptional MerR regulator